MKHPLLLSGNSLYRLHLGFSHWGGDVLYVLWIKLSHHDGHLRTEQKTSTQISYFETSGLHFYETVLCHLNWQQFVFDEQSAICLKSWMFLHILGLWRWKVVWKCFMSVLLDLCAFRGLYVPFLDQLLDYVNHFVYFWLWKNTKLFKLDSISTF